jgi:hypothetical protein
MYYYCLCTLDFYLSVYVYCNSVYNMSHTIHSCACLDMLVYNTFSPLQYAQRNSNYTNFFSAFSYDISFHYYIYDTIYLRNTNHLHSYVYNVYITSSSFFTFHILTLSRSNPLHSYVYNV